MSEREAELELIGELAQVIEPDAFDDNAQYLDDPAVSRAEAGMYARRVAAWLVEHDRAVSERAVTAYQLQASKVLLNLLPKNPHRLSAGDKEGTK